MAHSNLAEAKRAKNDEFYTRREDIENELSHYAEHFRGKVVYCNCDDPVDSEFWKFFVRNFKPWGLKKLMATHYEPDEKNYSYSLELTEDTNGDGRVDINDEPIITQLPCNGDFRSAACIELLKEADIVVTNPPFSLFREYVAQLMEYGKKFLIVGNPNAITYKEFFPLLKNNDVWVGYKSMGSDMLFRTSKEYESKLRQKKKEGSGYRIINGEFFARASAVWFTNLDIPKRHVPLDLRGNYYDPEKYPKYDNYDAINVNRVEDIPCDYDGIMGVPITYLEFHNADCFEIVGLSSKDHSVNVPRLHDNSFYNGYTRGKVVTRVESNMPLLATSEFGGTKCVKDGCQDIYQLYWRIFIRRK